MRKVKFKKWIPVVYEKTEGQIIERKKIGTGCWEEDFSRDGIFHQWANACEESESNYGNYTVALVELLDGTIEQVLPSNIKFIDPAKI